MPGREWTVQLDGHSWFPRKPPQPALSPFVSMSPGKLRYFTQALPSHEEQRAELWFLQVPSPVSFTPHTFFLCSTYACELQGFFFFFAFKRVILFSFSMRAFLLG